MSWSVQTLGTFVGPIGAGFLYDLTRRYAIAFGIFSIASLGAHALGKKTAIRFFLRQLKPR